MLLFFQECHQIPRLLLPTIFSCWSCKLLLFFYGCCCSRNVVILAGMSPQVAAFLPVCAQSISPSEGIHLRLSQVLWWPTSQVSAQRTAYWFAMNTQTGVISKVNLLNFRMLSEPADFVFIHTIRIKAMCLYCANCIFSIICCVYLCIVNCFMVSVLC